MTHVVGHAHHIDVMKSHDEPNDSSPRSSDSLKRNSDDQNPDGGDHDEDFPYGSRLLRLLLLLLLRLQERH